MLIRIVLEVIFVTLYILPQNAMEDKNETDLDATAVITKVTGSGNETYVVKIHDPGHILNINFINTAYINEYQDPKQKKGTDLDATEVSTKVTGNGNENNETNLSSTTTEIPTTLSAEDLEKKNEKDLGPTELITKVNGNGNETYVVNIHNPAQPVKIVFINSSVNIFNVQETKETKCGIDPFPCPDGQCCLTLNGFRYSCSPLPAENKKCFSNYTADYKSVKHTDRCPCSEKAPKCTLNTFPIGSEYYCRTETYIGISAFVL